MLGLGGIPCWKQEDEDKGGERQKETAPSPSYNWSAVRFTAALARNASVKDSKVLFASYLMLKE